MPAAMSSDGASGGGAGGPAEQQAPALIRPHEEAERLDELLAHVVVEGLGGAEAALRDQEGADLAHVFGQAVEAQEVPVGEHFVDGLLPRAARQLAGKALAVAARGGGVGKGEMGIGIALNI